MLNRRQFLTRSGIGGMMLLTSQPSGSFAQAGKEPSVHYRPHDYTRLLGMEGFSDTLLKNHFALYQGYVMNTNRLTDTLGQMARDGKTGTAEYAELKRRFGWEFNGMRLHEYYFENLGGKGERVKTSRLSARISEAFGNDEAWEKDFRATATLRGVGWTILYHDPLGKRLFNCWINEHETGHPSGCVPILILDVFEHAFMADYGLKRGDYISAFFRNIEWRVVESRLT